MSNGEDIKDSILNYVENFIDKRDNQLRATTEDDDADTRATRGVDREDIVITTDADEYQRERLVSLVQIDSSIS